MVRVLATLLPLLVSLATAAQAKTPQASLQRSLHHWIAKAGSRSGILVYDATTGQSLYSLRSNVRRMPASVEKLYTTSTALAKFGPAGTLTTSVLASAAPDAGGTIDGDLYLRGGGDPTFGGATFVRKYYGTGTTIESVAAAVAAAGVTRVTGGVIGDESRFDSRRGGPSSDYRYSSDDEASLGAIGFDRGLIPTSSGRPQGNQAAYAAAKLASALRHDGVEVAAGGHSGVAPAGARTIAHVSSPPMSTLVRMTNTPSDNYFAETLLKDLGARYGEGGTTADGASVVLDRLSTLLIRPSIVDGSGLSRFDRTSPAEIVGLLRDERNNTPFVASLAVVGHTGTLQYRMRGTTAAGECSAKTGTLHDVSNLAGYCSAADGHLLIFAELMNRISPNYAQGLQDRLTEAIAGYDG